MERLYTNPREHISKIGRQDMSKARFCTTASTPLAAAGASMRW